MGIVHTSVIIEEIYTPTAGRCVHIHLPAVSSTSTTTTTTSSSVSSATVTIQSPFNFQAQATQAAPPAASAAPATLVTLATAAKPKKKILGLRYADTGHVIPFIDQKGKYVSAKTKELIWVPCLQKWVGGPKYVPA